MFNKVNTTEEAAVFESFPQLSHDEKVEEEDDYFYRLTGNMIRKRET